MPASRTRAETAADIEVKPDKSEAKPGQKKARNEAGLNHISGDMEETDFPLVRRVTRCNISIVKNCQIMRNVIDVRVSVAQNEPSCARCRARDGWLAAGVAGVPAGL
jgi:hypothetical protein